MTNEIRLATLKNRLSTIEAQGKSTPGVSRKLRRQIRSLER